MIQPEEIRQKAENLYGTFVRAWLAGDNTFFPRIIPAQREPDADSSSAIQSVRALRDGSKECLGYGYSVEWREVNSRRFGRNRFPTRIVFDTQDDFLRFIGRQRSFDRFVCAVTEIRERYPSLNGWVRANVAALVEHEMDVPGLLEVTEVLLQAPRPGCFARELPVSVDTKFVEQNKTLLRKWLDLVLPPHAIRADEEHFERRYGLRYAEPHLFLRFLDSAIQAELGFPCDIVSVPLHTTGAWGITGIDVVIVENKVNLMTIPCCKRAIGLGAMGKAVSLLRYLPWLQNARITYWGDLDVEGLAILSDLRGLFPQTRSLFMDLDALEAWRHLAVPRTPRSPGTPSHLHDGELAAFAACSEHNLRVEQERIPQAAVLHAFRKTEFTLI